VGKYAFVVLILLSTVFSGCLFDNEDAKKCEDLDAVELVGCEFPEFNLISDDLTPFNNSNIVSQGRWVAYFSAFWCTHCKPTIDALDKAIPEDRMLVFNKYPGEDYDNMSEWKDNMEDELNRSISRPFIHAPMLAENLSVVAIPHVILVEDDTIVAVRYGLWDDTNSIIQWFESPIPSSGASQEMQEDQS
jgi:thiol-disulfide isomerase/thioredoxin